MPLTKPIKTVNGTHMTILSGPKVWKKSFKKSPSHWFPSSSNSTHGRKPDTVLKYISITVIFLRYFEPWTIKKYRLKLILCCSSDFYHVLVGYVLKKKHTTSCWWVTPIQIITSHRITISKSPDILTFEVWRIVFS